MRGGCQVDDLTNANGIELYKPHGACVDDAWGVGMGVSSQRSLEEGQSQQSSKPKIGPLEPGSFHMMTEFLLKCLPMMMLALACDISRNHFAVTSGIAECAIFFAPTAECRKLFVMFLYSLVACQLDVANQVG